MKPIVRILSYLVLAIVCFFGTSLFIYLDKFLKIDRVILTVGIGYCLINIGYSFLALKLSIFFRILIGITIGTISFWFAEKIGNLIFFPGVDPYGILTTIILNIVLLIIVWETIYQVNTKKILAKSRI